MSLLFSAKIIEVTFNANNKKINTKRMLKHANIAPQPDNPVVPAKVIPAKIGNIAMRK